MLQGVTKFPIYSPHSAALYWEQKETKMNNATTATLNVTKTVFVALLGSVFMLATVAGFAL